MKRLLLYLTMLICSSTGAWAQGANQIDITDLYLTNPSFETGDLTGWTRSATLPDNAPAGTQPSYAEIDARHRNGTYDFEGAEGDYVFNGWEQWIKQISIQQVTSQLPAGTYQLTTNVASWNGRQIKIDVSYGTKGGFLNLQNTTTTTTSTTTGTGEHQGVPLSVSFTSTRSETITFKVSSSTNWWDNQGDQWAFCFFKADDFHLYYTVPNNGIANTIASAMTSYADDYTGQGHEPMNINVWNTLNTAATDWRNARQNQRTKNLFETLLNAIHNAQESIEIYKKINEFVTYVNDNTVTATIQEKYNNGTYETLQEAINDYYLQKANALNSAEAEDYTGLIINPSFERGDGLGWTFPQPHDTDQITVTSGFPISSMDGNYLFNAYYGVTDLTLEQTLQGLTPGLYDLSAILAAWDGHTVVLAANNQEVNVIGVNDATGIPATVPVVVGSDGKLTIKVYTEPNTGDANIFFKADDFHLTRRKEAIDLVVTAAEWATLILPYDAAIPSGLHAYETDGYESDGKTLAFTEATTLVKNTPYIINGPANTYGFKEWVMDYYDDSYTVGYLTGCMVQTTIDKTQDGKQNYVLQKQGDRVAFFKVGDNTNKTIKAHRAYLSVPQSSEVKTAFYFPDEEEMATGINANTEENVTIAEVYSLNGQRQKGLQRGINVVRLTNGRVVKINVK